MKPDGTLYRLANRPNDFKRCHLIWKKYPERFGEPYKLGWPTVLAEREGKLIGFLSTNTSQGVIMAGPLIVHGVNGLLGPTLIRLIEAYEVVLRAAKVDSYVFHIGEDEKEWRSMIERSTGLTPYGAEKGRLFYRRNF